MERKGRTEQFMKRTVSGTLAEGMAGEKSGVDDDGEPMLEEEVSPRETKGFQEARHQDLSFLGNWGACSPWST